MTRLARYGDSCVEAGWLFIAVAAPLLLDPWTARPFDFVKTLVFRAVVALMVAAWAVRQLEERPQLWAAIRERGGAALPWKGAALWAWAKRNPAAAAAWAVAGAFLLSAVFSIAPRQSLWGAYRLTQGAYSVALYAIMFLLVASLLRRPEQWERLVRLILTASFTLSLYGLAQYYGLDPFAALWPDEVRGRISSAMGNPIFLGSFLAMTLPLTLAGLGRAVALMGEARRMPLSPGATGAELRALARGVGIILAQNSLLALALFWGLRAPNGWWAFPALGAGYAALGVTLPLQPARTPLGAALAAAGYAVLLLVQALALFYAASRGPWLGAAVGVGAFFFALALRRRLRLVLAGTAAAGVLGLAFIALLNLPHSPLQPLARTPPLSRLAYLSDLSSESRLLGWQGVWTLVAQHPSVGFGEDPLTWLRPLVGYGPDTLYLAFEKVYTARHRVLDGSRLVNQAHNDLLDHLAKVGVLGLAAWVLFLGAVLVAGWRLLWRVGSLGEQLWVAGLLGGVIGYLAEQQVGASYPPVRTYLWLYAAVLVGLRAGTETRADAGEPVGAAVPGRLGPGKRRSRGPRAPRLLSDGEPLFAPWLPRLALGGYLVLSIGGLGLLAAGAVLLATYETVVALLALGLALGLAVIALQLGECRAPQAWRGSRAWLYAIIIVAALSMAIASLRPWEADKLHQAALVAREGRQPLNSVLFSQKAVGLSPGEDTYYAGMGWNLVALASAARPPTAKDGAVSPPTAQTLRQATAPELRAMDSFQLLALAGAALEEASRLNPLYAGHYADLGRLYRLRGQLALLGQVEGWSSTERREVTEAAFREAFRIPTYTNQQIASRQRLHQLMDQLGPPPEYEVAAQYYGRALTLGPTNYIYESELATVAKGEG